MKKFEVACAVWKSIKSALQTPVSDKVNRFAMASYGALVVMVLLIVLMQLLMPGFLWWLWLAINIPMLCLYTTWFVWSVEGYFYRRDVKRAEAAFDQIVRGL